MKFLFGPVNSRRLGKSLGIDLFTEKTCNFNCIYCEVGPNIHTTGTRSEYVPTESILTEISNFLSDQNGLNAVDTFTLTASGEPTLHTGIGRIIRFLKKNTDKSVAVITNGSLLHLPDVREELLPADIVIPSLDSARSSSFHKINRPVSETDLETIIQGLRRFRHAYQGKIWLEILFVKGVNDSHEDLDKLQQVLDELEADRIQLNTVARPPVVTNTAPVSHAKLKELASKLTGPVEIIVNVNHIPTKETFSLRGNSIINMLKRRPCTITDISIALNAEPETVGSYIHSLEKEQLIIKKIHNGKKYYQTRE